jgi:endonuclease/exonuclease/phosphatase family metal-dependent hydrolase
MTFNVRGFHHQDGENAWPHREALNVATIRRCAPDLIGFQETQGGNVRAYHRELPAYHYMAWPWYDNQPPHAFNAIFWRPERLHPVDSDGFWLSETPGRFSGSWQTDNVRCATWIKFECLDSGSTFVHLNTHIDHRSEPARIEGTRLILERLRGATADGSAVIVTGDFNAPVGSAVYRMYSDADFIDAYCAAGNGDDPSREFTYHGWQGAAFRGSDDSPRRIDWILTRSSAPTSIATRSCEIIRDGGPIVYPSDHFPVVADIDVVATSSAPRTHVA